MVTAQYTVGTVLHCSPPRPELNPVLGRYPSNGRIVAYAAGMWAAESFVLQKTERSRWARGVCLCGV